MHPVPPALPHVCPSVSGNFRPGKVGADAQTKTMSEKAIIVRSKSISFIYINQIGGDNFSKFNIYYGVPNLHKK